GRYGVSQKASTRKARTVDVLIPEVWRKRRTQSRGAYFRKTPSEDKRPGLKVRRNDNDEILNTSVKSNDNQLPPLLNDHESEMNFNDTDMKDDIFPVLQPLVIKAALSTLSLNSTDSPTTETRRSSRQCTIPKQYNDYDM
ncbi:unnamed protein product, partial [Didymodactylos carnosus]